MAAAFSSVISAACGLTGGEKRCSEKAKPVPEINWRLTALVTELSRGGFPLSFLTLAINAPAALSRDLWWRRVGVCSWRHDSVCSLYSWLRSGCYRTAHRSAASQRSLRSFHRGINAASNVAIGASPRKSGMVFRLDAATFGLRHWFGCARFRSQLFADWQNMVTFSRVDKIFLQRPVVFVPLSRGAPPRRVFTLYGHVPSFAIPAVASGAAPLWMRTLTALLRGFGAC